MSFQVGQTIICVDDRFSNEVTMAMFQHWIIRDEEYVVRAARPEGAEGGILLEEIKNEPVLVPHFGGKLEPAFHPKRFVAKDSASEAMVEEAREILRQTKVDEIIKHGG